MKWYLCYEYYPYAGSNTYAREIRELGNCPYDTREEAEKALRYWQSVDPVQYGNMFVYQM